MSPAPWTILLIVKKKHAKNAPSYTVAFECHSYYENLYKQLVKIGVIYKKSIADKLKPAQIMDRIIDIKKLKRGNNGDTYDEVRPIKNEKNKTYMWPTNKLTADMLGSQDPFGLIVYYQDNAEIQIGIMDRNSPSGNPCLFWAFWRPEIEIDYKKWVGTLYPAATNILPDTFFKTKH